MFCPNERKRYVDVPEVNLKHKINVMIYILLINSKFLILPC